MITIGFFIDDVIFRKKILRRPFLRTNIFQRGKYTQHLSLLDFVDLLRGFASWDQVQDMVFEINHAGSLFLLEVSDVFVEFINASGIGGPEHSYFIIRLLENLLVVRSVGYVQIITWTKKKTNDQK